jgi:hypothetical protein
MTTVSLHLLVATPIPADGSGAAPVIFATMIVFAVVATIRWLARRAHVVVVIDGKNVALAALAILILVSLIVVSVF